MKHCKTNKKQSTDIETWRANQENQQSPWMPSTKGLAKTEVWGGKTIENEAYGASRFAEVEITLQLAACNHWKEAWKPNSRFEEGKHIGELRLEWWVRTSSLVRQKWSLQTANQNGKVTTQATHVILWIVCNIVQIAHVLRATSFEPKIWRDRYN